jgi:hypothetical protein
MSHPMFTLLAAALVAAAMGAAEPRQPREQLYVAARFIFYCLLSVAGGGWLMRLIHG